MSTAIPVRWSLFSRKCSPGNFRSKLPNLIKLSWRVAVHLSLVACVQGDPTNPSMTKNRMVGAIFDIQLSCHELPIELRTAAAIVHGHACITNFF